MLEAYVSDLMRPQASYSNIWWRHLENVSGILNWFAHNLSSVASGDGYGPIKNRPSEYPDIKIDGVRNLTLYRITQQEFNTLYAICKHLDSLERNIKQTDVPTDLLPLPTDYDLGPTTVNEAYWEFLEWTKFRVIRAKSIFEYDPTTTLAFWIVYRPGKRRLVEPTFMHPACKPDPQMPDDGNVCYFW